MYCVSELLMSTKVLHRISRDFCNVIQYIIVSLSMFIQIPCDELPATRAAQTTRRLMTGRLHPAKQRRCLVGLAYLAYKLPKLLIVYAAVLIALPRIDDQNFFFLLRGWNSWEKPSGFIFGACFSNVSYQQRNTKLPSHCARRNWYHSSCAASKRLEELTERVQVSQPHGRDANFEANAMHRKLQSRKASRIFGASGRDLGGSFIFLLINFQQFDNSGKGSDSHKSFLRNSSNPSCGKHLSQFVLSEICSFLSCPALDCTNTI